MRNLLAPPLGRSRLAAIVMSWLVAASSRGQAPGPGPAAPLTQTSSYVETVPAMSADGHVIACHAGPHDAFWQGFGNNAPAVAFDLTAPCGGLVEQRITTPSEHQLGNATRDLRPSVSLDGSRIAVGRNVASPAAGFVQFELHVSPRIDAIGSSVQSSDASPGFSMRPQMSGDGDTVWMMRDTSTFPQSSFKILGPDLAVAPIAECDASLPVSPGIMQPAITSDGGRIVGDHYEFNLHQIWRVDRPALGWCAGIADWTPFVTIIANAEPVDRFTMILFATDPVMKADGSIIAWSSQQDHCQTPSGALNSSDIWLWFENPADVPAWSSAEIQTCNPPAPTPGKLVRIITSLLSPGVEAHDTQVTIDAAGDVLTFLSDRNYDGFSNASRRPSVFALDLRAGSLPTAVSQISETLESPQAVVAHALSSNGNVSAYTLAYDDVDPFRDADLRVVNLVQGSEPRQPDARPPAEEPFEVEVTSCIPFGSSVELRAMIRRWRGGARTLLVTPTVEEGAVRQSGSPVAQKLGDEEFVEIVLIVDPPIPMTSPTCTLAVVDGSQSHADVQVGVAP